jgi:hypothetical protein
MILGFQDYVEFAFSRRYGIPSILHDSEPNPETKNASLITQVRRMDRTQNGCKYAEYDSLGLAVPALVSFSSLVVKLL